MRDTEGNALDARVEIVREREELKILFVFCSRVIAMADDTAWIECPLRSALQLKLNVRDAAHSGRLV